MKPGSPDALKAGCTCSPVENNDGAGCNAILFTAWIIMIGCPVHDKESENGSGNTRWRSLDRKKKSIQTAGRDGFTR
jgi:hypothetical protein